MATYESGIPGYRFRLTDWRVSADSNGQGMNMLCGRNKKGRLIF